MPNINRLIIAGHAGRDGELRYTADANPKLEFSLAVSDGYKNKKTNQWEDQTEWFNVVVWGDQAERIAERVTKGAALFVEGKLRTRSWDGNDGQKHYRTEVIADRVQFLSVKPDGMASGAPASRRAARVSPANKEVDIDDLPFE